MLFNIAGWIAQQTGSRIPGETLCWRRHPDKFTRAKISQDDADQIVEDVKAARDALRSALASAKF